MMDLGMMRLGWEWYLAAIEWKVINPHLSSCFVQAAKLQLFPEKLRKIRSKANLPTRIMDTGGRSTTLTVVEYSKCDEKKI